MKNSHIIIAAVFTILFVASQHIRAEIIETWSYDVEATFDSWYGPEGTRTNKSVSFWQNAEEHVNRVKGNDGISFSDDYTIMEWSSADNRTSGLSLEGLSGKISTDGSSVTAMTMTHSNKTIGTSNPTPKILEIAIDVVLTGIYDDGDTFSIPLKLAFTLGFLETPNIGNGALDGHTEDDIFFIIDNPSSSQTFTDKNGNTYEISIDSTFNEITGVHLATAAHYINERFEGVYTYDPDQLLYGFTTREGKSQENAMDIQLVVRQITTSDSTTPEPGTLIVMSLAGILGVPVYRRMKKNMKSW